MESWIIKGCVWMLLVWNGILDYRKHEISLTSLGVLGCAGIGLNCWIPYQSMWEILGGVGVGLLLILAAFVTREAIGFGDGLLVCVTGIYLGFWENMNLVLIGTAFCALVMGVGVLFRRVQRTDRFPLVPFLCLAYLGRMIG